MDCYLKIWIIFLQLPRRQPAVKSEMYIIEYVGRFFYFGCLCLVATVYNTILIYKIDRRSMSKF